MGLFFSICFHQPNVVRQWEFSVHIQFLVFWHEYGEIGARTPIGDGGLLHIIHVFDKADYPEHVLGHTLTPLSPSLGVGQDVPEGRRAAIQAGEHGFETFRLFGPVDIQVLDGLVDPVHAQANLTHLMAKGAILALRVALGLEQAEHQDYRQPRG